MINQRPIELNPYLKMRGESQLRAKHAFERAAGWRYGMVFGALILLMAYAWDAFQLFTIHTEFWWVKLALALVTIFPLAVFAGGVGGHVNWFLKLPIWMVFGIVGAWVVIRLPFDGARVVLQNFDVNLQLVEFLPIPDAAAASFGMLGTLGACLGILAGLLQSVTVNWAWERSTDDYRLTLSGWAMFLLALPVAFAYAFLFDGTAHLPLRAPQQLIHSVIQSGLNDAPDQDQTQMEIHRALVYLTGQRWKKNFTPEYIVRLASSEPSAVGESYVDVTFTNGFNWRCRITTYGEFTGGCYDLNAEYTRYLSEFIPRGSFRCADCQARVARQAAQWRAENARELTSTDKIQLAHGAGSSIRARVQSQNQNSFECLLWGANPVIVESCESK